MRYYRINTDRDARHDQHTYDIWYDKNMAFTGDYETTPLWTHAKVFTKLNTGDGIFMHHSRLGIVGYGRILEQWNGKYYTADERILYKKEKYEYRISVDWLPEYDRRNNPLSINHRLPYVGTWSTINLDKWDIKLLLAELATR